MFVLGVIVGGIVGFILGIIALYYFCVMIGAFYMTTKHIFIFSIILLLAIAAGIIIGSQIAQATARQLAVLDHAKMRAMETEILQMREEYLAILNESPRASK